jgi:hypothetical protein
MQGQAEVVADLLLGQQRPSTAPSSARKTPANVVADGGSALG